MECTPLTFRDVPCDFTAGRDDIDITDLEAQYNILGDERLPLPKGKPRQKTGESQEALDARVAQWTLENTDFLNTLSLSGLPKHELRLKPNMVVMLLRNLSPIEGLCNGTRLLVQDVINGRLLQAVIATGSHAGEVVFIPRIKLSPDEGLFPFSWSRLQFPVRVAFAMTINKAQGQTLTRVGVYLEQMCFSHGQL